MIKLIARSLSVVLAVVGCYCVAYPQTPRRWLEHYVKSREVAAQADGHLEPASDVVLVKTAIAVLDAHVSKPSIDDAESTPDKTELSGVFFDDEPKSALDYFSSISIPFLSNESETPYQPVDTGPEIQANPFLD
jgi:hypothetical protein